MIHMEGSNIGGGGRVGAGEDDMSDGMLCMNHPHRNNNNNNPGGICAFCLQEKLGKLVSSSSPLPIHPSSSSSPPSSSPSFRSNTASSSATTTHPTSASFTSKTTSAPAAKKNGTDHHHYHEHYMRSRLPFLLPKKNKKKPISTNSSSSSAAAAAATSDIIFKRSKSTATPRRRGKFLDEAEDDDDIVNEDFNFISPRKRNWFWSFLYLSSKPSSSPLSSSSTNKFDGKSFMENSNGSPRMSAVNAASCTSREKCSSLGSSSLGRKSDMVVEEEEEGDSTSASSLERKVSRSRSVGCGSRSFSGDFFERISTGFGDCTLRRVESQREGSKTKVAAAAAATRGNSHHHHHCMKERVMCGGLFGGFMLTSSSSYWVSSSADNDGMNNGRGRSWGWAFASPMRAFGTKTSSKDNKRDNIRDGSDKNATPNLSAIPSLLTVNS